MISEIQALGRIWDWLKEAAIQMDWFIDESHSVRNQGILHLLSGNCRLPYISFTIHIYGKWALIDAYRRMPTDADLWQRAKKELCSRLFHCEKLEITLPAFVNWMCPEDKLNYSIIERAIAASLLHDIFLQQAEKNG
jgi:hypothetical protein